MGTNVSKSVAEVVNESSLEVSTKIDTNFEQNIYQGSLVNQINNFESSNISGCCGNLVTMLNDTESEQYIAAELSNEQSVQLIQDLSNKLESEFEKTLEQEGSWIPGLNMSDSQSNVKNIINSLVDNEILISTVQRVYQTSAALQQNNVKNGNITCPCINDKEGNLIEFESMFDMTNRSAMSQVSEAMAEQVLDIFASTSLEQDLESSFKETITQKGFDFTALIIGIVVVMILAIILLIVLKSAKKKAVFNKYRVNNGILESFSNIKNK